MTHDTAASHAAPACASAWGSVVDFWKLHLCDSHSLHTYLTGEV